MNKIEIIRSYCKRMYPGQQIQSISELGLNMFEVEFNISFLTFYIDVNQKIQPFGIRDK